MSDAASRSNGAVPARVAVRKTYKLYIGGAFPRSESGRSYVVTDQKDRFLANAALASRKDARDAVTAARKAFGGWSAATAYNRGQVLYRVAELLEGRTPHVDPAPYGSTSTLDTNASPRERCPRMTPPLKPERGRNEEEELATRRTESFGPSARLARCLQLGVYLIGWAGEMHLALGASRGR